jgi:hypothetical protein
MLMNRLFFLSFSFLWINIQIPVNMCGWFKFSHTSGLIAHCQNIEMTLLHISFKPRGVL